MFRVKGKSYEVPKKTIKLNRMINDINNTEDTEEAYYNMYKFINEALDEQTIIDILETNDINEMDLVELNLLCNAIVNEYEKRTMEDQIEKLSILTNSKEFEKIIQVSKAIENREKTKK